MTSEWLRLFSFAIGGLAIFYFGLRLLSEGLQAASAALIRAVLNGLTENRLIAFLIGFLVTVLVQSSAISSVMTVGFVNAGLMSFLQSVSIVIGANVGTTLTPWLFIVRGGADAFLLTGIGLIWLLVPSNSSFSQWGKVVFAIGLVFLGFQTMTNAFVPLGLDGGFLSWAKIFSGDQFSGLLAGVGAGCLLTLIFRRSSAVIGLVMAMAAAGVFGLAEALALVMGTNIGTTLTTVLSSLPANVVGRRVAFSHALFNLTIVILGCVFFDSYLRVMGTFDGVGLQIAIAHSGLNLAGALLFLPFLDGMEQFLTHIAPAPSRKEPQRLVFFGSVADVAPSLAIEQAYQEVKKLAAMVQSLLSLTKDYLSSHRHDEETWKRIQKYEGITDNIQTEMTRFLGIVMERRLTTSQSRAVKSYLRITDELESVADKCQIIARYRKQLFENGVVIEKEVASVLEMFSDLVIEQYDLIFTSIAEGTEFKSGEYDHSVNKFNDFSKDLGERCFGSFFDEKIGPLAGLALNEISVQMREIRGHTTNIIDAYLGKKHSRLMNH